ncbi:MAG: protein-S-isoprenylcysteine O-methyltransferase Ste14 [Cyclobacteriaceae bacterium]|jgi:protein-S-isoprenylcysteine O-methyltransferase Ste14
MLDYIILFISWGVYFFTHSLLASSESKRNFIGEGRLSKRTYRLSYSIISMIGLILIIWLQYYLRSASLFAPSYLTWMTAGVLFCLGANVLSKSFKKISITAFLGLQVEGDHKLVKEDIHQYVRHPIYLGTILIFISLVIAIRTDLIVVSLFAVFIYLPIGIILEEDKLVKEYGADYLTYRQETKSIFPKWKYLLIVLF